jgi:hypothetical protein
MVDMQVAPPKKVLEIAFFFLPLPLTLKISVFGKTGNYGRGIKGKITEK